MIFNQEKIEIAKEILEVETRFYSPVFNLFVDEIDKLLKLNLKYKTIYKLLKKELNADFSYKVFIDWINKTFNTQNSLKSPFINKKTDIKNNNEKNTQNLKNEESIEEMTKAIENLWTNKEELL